MKRTTMGGGVSGHFAGLAGNGFRVFLDPNQTAGGGATPPANQQQQAPPANNGQPAGQQQAVGAGANNAAAPGQTQGAPAAATTGAELAAVIGMAIAQALTPLAQGIQAQGQQITQMATQFGQIQGMGNVGNGGGTQAQPIIHGHAPNQRQGESVLGSRGFQLSRLAQFVQGNGTYNRDNCKVELELSDRLRNLYQSNGAQGLHDANALYVPLASEHIIALDQAIGLEVRQMTQAGIAGFSMEHAMQMAQWARVNSMGHQNSMMTQALSIYDDTALGLFVSQLQLGEMIPMLRASNALQQAGAREITLPPNGMLPFGEQVGALTAYHVGTGEATLANRTITESTPATGMRYLRAKKLACLSRLPREFLAFATQSVEAFIRADMAIVMGLKESETLLFTGAATDLMPKALISYTNINTVIADTTGTDGNTIQPTDLDKMAATVEEQNVPIDDRFTVIMRPMLAYKLANRRADAVSAGDAAGPFVFLDLAMNAVTARKNIIRGYNLVKSTQVPNNRAKGAASNLTMAVGGDFREFVIGRHGVMQIDTNTMGTNEFVRDEMLIRAIEYYDGLPRREKAFALMDSLRVA